MVTRRRDGQWRCQRLVWAGTTDAKIRWMEVEEEEEEEEEEEDDDDDDGGRKESGMPSGVVGAWKSVSVAWLLFQWM